METSNKKVILATGASRGIGAAVAHQLAVVGTKVIVNYADGQEAAEAIANAIKTKGDQDIALQVEVSEAGKVALCSSRFRSLR